MEEMPGQVGHDGAGTGRWLAGLQQVGVFGFGDKLGGVGGVKLHKKFLAVPFDGFRTETDFVCYLGTGETLSHQAEDFLLSV